MDEEPEDLIAAALDLHQSGQTDAAEAAYRAILEAHPTAPTPLYLLSLILMETERHAEAGSRLRALVALRPRNPAARVSLARLLLLRGAAVEARLHLEAALSAHPDDPEALCEFARLLIGQGDAAAAEPVAEHATNVAPELAEAWRLLGAARMQARGREAEAVAAYRQALVFEPDSGPGRAGLAFALLAVGDPLAALDACLEEDEALLLPRGLAQVRLGRFAEGVETLEQVLTHSAGSTTALMALAKAYSELKDRERAVACLQRAIAIDPGLAEAHTLLSSVYVLMEDADAAEAAARAALALDPDQMTATQNLAAVIEGKGDAEAARALRKDLYRRTRVVVEPAPAPDLTVLLLLTGGPGSVPHRDLLPKARYSKINWFIEYAEPGDAEGLPPFDVVFNAVGDADMAGRALGPTQAFLEAFPGPILNAPDRVMKTHRSDASILFAGINHLVTPRAVRLTAGAVAKLGVATLAKQFDLAPPLLIRPVGGHGGQGLKLVQTEAELAAFVGQTGQDLYLTQFYDFRSADGWCRKYRMIFVDRRPFAYHLAISTSWLIHYETARMQADDGRLDEERRFLADPQAVLGAAAFGALSEVGRRLDLDFAGVDFALLPNRDALIFEANATMLVHAEDEDGPFAHKNPTVAAICSAFQALVHAKARPRRDASPEAESAHRQDLQGGRAHG